MSHHFDNPNAGDDPRLNINDFYLFSGGAGRTVMAMTVNPDAGLSAPDTLRDEGLYAFRFDINGDDVEEVTFKFRFTAPSHTDDDPQRHVQTYEVRRGVNADAVTGADGAMIAGGRTGETAVGPGDVRVWVGLAPDLFAGDGVAISKWKDAFYRDGRSAPEQFQNRQNLFAKRNVTAIVLEVPDSMIGAGSVRAWATTSLYGHAPEVQVCRWGWPLFTHIFMLPDQSLSIAFNQGVPAQDLARFGAHVRAVGEKWSRLAGTLDSAAYADQLVSLLLPNVLPYRLDTQGVFDFAGVNGRGLGDDVMDVILSETTNSALADGVAPDRSRIRSEFPYFGKAFTHEEQADVRPAVARGPSVHEAPPMGSAAG